MKFLTCLAILAFTLCASVAVFAQADATTPAVTPVTPVMTVMTVVNVPGIPADNTVLKKTAGSDWNYRTTPVTVMGKTYEDYAFVSRTFIQYVYFNIKDSTATLSTDVAYSDASINMTGKVVIELNGEVYKTLTIKQGRLPQHLEIPFTGKNTMRITPSDDKILFLSPRLLPGTPVALPAAATIIPAPVADPLVDKLVSIMIQLRATALAKNDKVYADSLEQNLLFIGIKLTDTPAGITIWARTDAPAAPESTTPAVPAAPAPAVPAAPAPVMK